MLHEFFSTISVWKVLTALSILCIGCLLFFYFFKEYSPKEDGFINRYNSLPSAFEKKQQLFGSGSIEEVSGSFGFGKGSFSRTNQSGDGWSFIKNDTPILWDGTEEGTVDLYKFWDENGSDKHLYYFDQETAANFSCYLGLPVSAEVKSYKEVGSNSMGNSVGENAVWIVVSIPNDMFKKASIEELMTVFSFVHESFLPSRMEYFYEGLEKNIEFIKQRISFEEDSSAKGGLYRGRIKDSKVLGEQYMRLKNYAENPSLLQKCQEEKMKGIKNPYIK